MLRRLYDWVIRQADKPYALWVMIGISFTESSFFPVVPDIILIPMILAQRRRAFWLATAATVSSVLGGYLGYAIGHFAYDTVGRYLIEHLWSVQGFADAKTAFDKWGFWLIVGKGATPIPYKIVTILCGVLGYDLWKFTLASLIARGMRFYLLAVLLYFFGDQVRNFVETRLKLVVFGIAAAVIGFILLLHYL